SYLVPAHVWTPWFAVLGSKSGFDAIGDCYADLAEHIFALETGLSSDPDMNWKISALDRYRLVSNSDAHSPPMLGREATVFDTDLDYYAVRRALQTGAGHEGTIEFFPEEGKYHVDGHRKCGVRLEPDQTREHGGRCPECGKPLTVGVLNRVEELADREAPVKPEGAAGFRCLVQLPEVMSEIVGTGPKSKRVLSEIDKLTAALGPELAILQDVPADDIGRHSTLLAEAVTRLRRGEVIREAGYDGEYGVIRLFESGELSRLSTASAPALFDEPLPASSTPAASSTRATRATATAPPSRRPPSDLAAPQVTSQGAGLVLGDTAVPDEHGATADGGGTDFDGSLLDGLDPDQRAATEIAEGPLLIIAGPGTGKTRTLTHRIAHLLTAHDVPPEQCLAITFTRRAADEMSERLAALTPEHAQRLTIATFHALGVRILREQHERVGLGAHFGIADRAGQLAVAADVAGSEAPARRLLDDPTREPELAERYRKELRRRDLVDFDDLVRLPVTLLESDPELAASYQRRYRWISVDEYQDVDEWQYRLLRRLAPPDGNLTAIGDPDQAIYRFRGADVGFFLRFRRDFPAARTVALTRNYRCNPAILTGALRVVAPSTLVPDRELRPVGGGHGDALVGVHHAADEQAEASFVARTIDRLLGGSSFHSLDSGRVDSDGTQGLDLSDFAVLYRTGRQARAVMEALATAGLPFQRRSHDRLAERPGVEPILAELGYQPAGTPGRSVLARLRVAAAAVLERFDNPEAVHSAVDLLTPLAVRCEDDLPRFRAELSLGVEVDTWDPRADRVSLLTLHAAKGLEFPVVFVIGCEDGLLPLRWPGTPPDDEHVREERRLLFVGMTRARQHLYLSHAGERSPFLADLGTAVSERIGDAVPRRRPRDTQLRLL
ncbi:MAG: UvrD-helicase domain-containing protein, partial [Pseudonocardia sp.]|nr:UvrD-helicase domain-containing protein [Pseudonocardia sp.]